MRIQTDDRIELRERNHSAYGYDYKRSIDLKGRDMPELERAIPRAVIAQRDVDAMVLQRISYPFPSASDIEQAQAIIERDGRIS